MREFRSRGSVRGAAGNGRPYRDRISAFRRMSDPPPIASGMTTAENFPLKKSLAVLTAIFHSRHTVDAGAHVDPERMPK